MQGRHEICQTEKALVVKQDGRFHLRFESEFTRSFDLGAFYADLAERKTLRFYLWRKRGKANERVRCGGFSLEEVMDLARPIQERHVHLLGLEGQKVTTESLYIQTTFYPAEVSLAARDLDSRYFAHPANMRQMMWEAGDDQPIDTLYGGKVPLGRYQPVYLQKFFGSRFYKKFEEERAHAAGLHDVFMPLQGELVWPLLDESGFRMRQGRLWDAAEAARRFHGSYGAAKYQHMYLGEA